MQQYGSLIVAAIRADREKLDRNYSAYVYYENHHIWPKCFGRDDRDQNLVLLTYAEHVEAHVLLAKLYPRKPGIQAAADYMLKRKNNGLVSIELASEAKELAAAASSLRWAGEGNPAKKLKNREASGNRNRLLAENGKLSFQSPESQMARSRRSKLSWSSNRNPSKKPENRKAITERARTKTLCHHCNKVGQSINMKRWHFDSCLQHPDNLGLTRQQIKARKLAAESLPSTAAKQLKSDLYCFRI